MLAGTLFKLPNLRPCFLITFVKSPENGRARVCHPADTTTNTLYALPPPLLFSLAPFPIVLLFSRAFFLLSACRVTILIYIAS